MTIDTDQSPRPWRLQTGFQDAVPTHPVTISDATGRKVLSIHDRETAELIIKAVNSFDALVTAMELTAKINPFGSIENAKARDAAQAALALAKSDD